MFCAKKKIPGRIWNLQWGWDLHVEGKTVYVGFSDSYPEIRFLIKALCLTFLPVEFCGMLPEMWTLLSVTLYSDSEASAQKRQNDCEVLGGYALESESVDLVASVLTLMSVVVASAWSSPHQSPEARLLRTEEQPHVGRHRPKERMRTRLCKVSMPRLERKVKLLEKRNSWARLSFLSFGVKKLIAGWQAVTCAPGVSTSPCLPLPSCYRLVVGLLMGHHYVTNS